MIILYMSKDDGTKTMPCAQNKVEVFNFQSCKDVLDVSSEYYYKGSYCL